jgi:nucleoside-diphosphate-sugar epimerase
MVSSRVSQAHYSLIRTFLVVSPKHRKIPEALRNTGRCFASNNSVGIKEKKILVITGGRAQMAPVITREAIERGYISYSCTRSKPIPDVLNTNWEKIEEQDMQKAATWKELFMRISHGADSLCLVNTIGTAVAPKGKTLQDVNERPVLAALEALKSLKIRRSIGHISSIAATYLPDDEKLLRIFDPQGIEYCLGRRRVDLIIQSNGVPATILRPGFIFHDLREGRIDTGHDYSPEQFTELLVHPLIGSGKQLHQPVYAKDVVQALFNGMETDQTYLIDAVGPQQMTQEEMIKFFLDLARKPFKPVRIPYEVASVIARHFPKGRVAPYAISLLRHLEDQNKNPLSVKAFEILVGKPLSSIGEIYQTQEEFELLFPKSPIFEHVKEIIASIAINPEARKDFLRIATKYGPSLVLESIKAYLVYNKS